MDQSGYGGGVGNWKDEGSHCPGCLVFVSRRYAPFSMIGVEGICSLRLVERRETYLEMAKPSKTKSKDE